MKREKKRFWIAVLVSILLLNLCACTAEAPIGPALTSEVPVPDELSDKTLETPPAFEESVDWSAEYDVVVVGYGGAGAVASITAADAGANVLLLEKAPEGEEGGNTRVSGQGVQCFNDLEEGILYYKSLTGGFDNVSDEIIETYVRMSMENPDWIASMGCDTFVVGTYAEYPEMPGSGATQTGMIDSDPYSAKFYQLLHDNVESRRDSIDVWFSSPGVELIQDPETKIIHGIKVDMQGKLVSVRAKNGVILACGGFENNEDMVENYLQMAYGYAKGSKYNTGDGIKMAMKVGADLWHMSAISGPDPNFKADDMEHSFGYMLTGSYSPAKSSAGFCERSAIVVGSDGTRYVDETLKTRHGHVNNHGTWVSMQIPTPSFLIFDEAARLAGPIYSSWSADNSAELEKGWILQADTLDELAKLTGIDAEGLKAEISRYNDFCAAGVDPDQNRPTKYLVPISADGPYYALELAPTFTNTQGGPRRNENAEILDVDGNPIPHLYSAGELGSIHADTYNGGGNLSECIVFGRIAGKNAAAAKTDVSSASMMGDKTPVAPEVSAEITAGQGELLGEANGMGGRLVVKVKMDGDAISSVEVVLHHETAGVCDTAIATLPQAIIEANTPDVDTVSGATRTSLAIINAVKDALSKAD